MVQQELLVPRNQLRMMPICQEILVHGLIDDLGSKREEKPMALR